MGLILGVDICDDYSQISSYDTVSGDVESITLGGEGAAERIPTVICKKNGCDEWLIGEEAYRNALIGQGTLVDRLVRLAIKNGSATLEGTKYKAEQLMFRFVQKVIGLAGRRYETDEIDSLVFTLHESGPRINDVLIRVAESLKVSREKVHIYTHTECFVYYILSQNSEIWSNQVSMFDLKDNAIYYYELRAIRGRRPVVIEAAREKLPEGFSLSVLDTPAGEKLADSILSSCAERVLAKKTVSSVVLTGKGFETTNWAGEFLNVICNRRRVFQSSQIFAQGAAYAAYDHTLEKSAYPYLFICEGRLASTVSLYAVFDGRREQIVFAQAGTNWYEAGTKASFIVDDIKDVILDVTPVAGNKPLHVSVSLDELPSRPNKTTRIELSVTFSSEKKMVVKIKDCGFGDLFPSSGIVIRGEYFIP